MGIYIPGMEIPTEKYGTMTITIYPNGHVAEYVGDMGRVWNAIPVPAHGRLVDADNLCKVLKALAADEWNQGTAPFSWSYAYDCMADTVNSMPTVIQRGGHDETKQRVHGSED